MAGHRRIVDSHNNPKEAAVKLNLSTEALARGAARRPWTTIGIWLGVLVTAFILISTLLGDALTTEDRVTNNPESEQANALMEERLGASDDTIDEMVIVRSATLTVDDPAYQSYVEGLYDDLVALGDDVIAGGTHYYMEGEESLVSASRLTTIIALVMPEGAEEEIEKVHQVVDRASEGGSFEVLITGDATMEEELVVMAEKDLQTGEAIGISVALVVLALVFGAIAAALLPIVLAIAAIVVALGATALVGLAFDLTFFVTNMITMMGLAVGIDYSLFIVSRYREERAKGLEKIDAIAAAGATASKAVLFSGMTVVLALLGLMIFPLSVFQSMGAGTILVVISAVLASMTLLPAVLSLMGDKVNAIRIPFIQRRKTASASESKGGFWDWTARTVMRRPVVGLALAGTLLVAALVPYFDINRGFSGISTLPDGLRTKDGFIALQEEFGFGQDTPTLVVIDGQTDSESVQAAIERLETSLAADPAFIPSGVQTYPETDLSVFYTRLAGDPQSQGAMDAVTRLRAEYIPQAFNGVPARVLVGGDIAMMLDFTDTTDIFTPIIFAFVLSLSFVLLTVAFRSIVVPVTAIMMNLLSVGAAYGLLVLVFQKGIGAGVLGLQQTETVEVWLPLFLFAILFGLSMDYQVFLLSRIRERFLQTGDNTDAVAFGLRSTGRLITGAALIMVAVFGGFALGDMVQMQQMGFGLAVAVFMDATIVRSILVPSTMRLLGKWNWYLPRWLEWLPRVGIGEGAPTETQLEGQPAAKAGAHGAVPVPATIPTDE
jgi:RND superfamily putative drug exporter